MEKRQLHHLWTKVRRIKPWYFLVLAIISTVICVFTLRANNQHMIKLRQAVYEADKNNQDTESALKSLQAYVTTHMNTSLTSGQNSVYPPIQLKYTYERLITAQTENASRDGNQLYIEAQRYCEGQNSTDFSGRNRIPCIEQYVDSHGGTQQTAIPDSLYKFNFVSPIWSKDLAGWSTLAAIIFWLAFVSSLLVNVWFKRAIR